MIRPDWPAPANVHAWTTTREGGASRAPFATFNLATHVGDEPDAVGENRRRLVELLDLPRQPLWLDQVHGKNVVDVGSAAGCPTADAGFSLHRNRVCAVLTADCLPVLFCDRQGSRVAAAHAGWRGLAGGVLEQTIAALGGQPGQLMAWLGPAIGPQSFEVGEEVRDAFVRDHALAAGAFQATSEGRWLADLYRLAQIRLGAAGVTDVYGGAFCTFLDRQRFYSYRRDQATGRMASLIWLS